MKSPERRIGITDVARAAGVSCCTVSQTLNGKRPVGAEVRQRVVRAIQKLGYHPNPTARSLVLKRTLQIGVVVDGVTNGIAAVTVESIGRKLHAHGYKTLLALCSGERRQTALAYLKEFSSGMVDGVINMMPEIGIREAEQLCRGVPVVTYRRPADHPSDIVDLAGATVKVLTHLWSLGHRKIGLFASDECPGLPGSRREDSYRCFFKAQGLAPDERLIEHMDWADQDAAIHAARLFKAGATAIFASSDGMASGILQWAYRTGVKVPEQLSVVGLEDTPLARMTTPNLTTLHIPVEELSDFTVNRLFALIRGKPTGAASPIVPGLVIRESTGPAPTAATTRSRKPHD